MRGRSATQIARRAETGRSSRERTAARMTKAFFWRQWRVKMATAQRHHLQKSRQSHSLSSWVSFSSPLQNNSVAIRPCHFRVNSRTSLFDLFAFFHVYDMMQPTICVWLYTTSQNHQTSYLSFFLHRDFSPHRFGTKQPKLR